MSLFETRQPLIVLLAVIVLGSVVGWLVLPDESPRTVDPELLSGPYLQPWVVVPDRDLNVRLAEGPVERTLRDAVGLATDFHTRMLENHWRYAAHDPEDARKRAQEGIAHLVEHPADAARLGLLPAMLDADDPRALAWGAVALYAPLEETFSDMSAARALGRSLMEAARARAPEDPLIALLDACHTPGQPVAAAKRARTRVLEAPDPDAALARLADILVADRYIAGYRLHAALEVLAPRMRAHPDDTPVARALTPLAHAAGRLDVLWNPDTDAPLARDPQAAHHARNLHESAQSASFYDLLEPAPGTATVRVAFGPQARLWVAAQRQADGVWFAGPLREGGLDLSPVDLPGSVPPLFVFAGSVPWLVVPGDPWTAVPVLAGDASGEPPALMPAHPGILEWLPDVPDLETLAAARVTGAVGACGQRLLLHPRVARDAEGRQRVVAGARDSGGEVLVTAKPNAVGGEGVQLQALAVRADGSPGLVSPLPGLMDPHDVALPIRGRDFLIVHRHAVFAHRPGATPPVTLAFPDLPGDPIEAATTGQALALVLLDREPEEFQHDTDAGRNPWVLRCVVLDPSTGVHGTVIRVGEGPPPVIAARLALRAPFAGDLDGMALVVQEENATPKLLVARDRAAAFGGVAGPAPEGLVLRGVLAGGTGNRALFGGQGAAVGDVIADTRGREYTVETVTRDRGGMVTVRDALTGRRFRITREGATPLSDGDPREAGDE